MLTASSPSTLVSPMALARALGGEYRDGKIHAPGPGHSKRDRSLIVWLDPNAPNGFRVHSFADDPIACRDYVSDALGFEPWTPRTQLKARHPVRNHSPAPAQSAALERDQQASRTDRLQQARWLWSCRHPIPGTIAETYLRQVRGYHGPLNATLGFLPARGEYAPAIIAAFGLPQEPEPGTLSMPIDSIAAVHLIRLRGDGLGKVAEKPKITIGSPGGMPIVVAPLNDGLALAITEGIEDALSVSSAGFGAWAAGSAGFMPSLANSIPAYTDAVTIVADNNNAGIQGADELARRIVVRGIHVERIFPEVEGVL